MSTRPPSTSSPGAAAAGDVLALIRSGRATTRGELGRLTGLSRTAVSARLTSLADAGLVLEGGEELRHRRPPARHAWSSTATPASCWPSRSGAAARSWRCSTSTAPSSPRLSHDQEVGAGPDDGDAGRRRAARRACSPTLGRPAPRSGASACQPARHRRPRRGGERRLPRPGRLGRRRPGALPPRGHRRAARRRQRRQRDGALRALRPPARRTTTCWCSRPRPASGSASSPTAASGPRPPRRGRRDRPRQGRRRRRPARAAAATLGCLETVAGGWALVERLRAEGDEVDHVRDLVALAVHGDGAARAIVRESGRRVGEVLAAAVTLLNPQRRRRSAATWRGAFDIFAAGLRESALRRPPPRWPPATCRSCPPTYGDRAGLVGCVSLALDEVLSPRAVDAALAARRG